MDSSLDIESLKKYIKNATFLNSRNILTPKIFQSNAEDGFLLISDFGDNLLYFDINSENMELHYSKLLKVLTFFQYIPLKDLPLFPLFDRSRMFLDLESFDEFFLQKFLSISLEKEKTLVLNVKISNFRFKY